VVHEIVLLKVV
jgi:hypothetical protein